MVDKTETLANFLAITDADDERTALNMLEATDWVLDAAVNLFFASGEAQGMANRIDLSTGNYRYRYIPIQER